MQFISHSASGFNLLNPLPEMPKNLVEAKPHTIRLLAATPTLKHHHTGSVHPKDGYRYFLYFVYVYE